MKNVICLLACLLSFNLGAMDEGFRPIFAALFIHPSSESIECFDCPVVNTPDKKDEDDCFDCPVVNTPVKKDEDDCFGYPECDLHGVVESWSVGSPSSIVADLQLYSIKLQSKKQ